MHPLWRALFRVPIPFPNGRTAHAVQVQDWQDLSTALKIVGLDKSCPVLVLIGGASHLSPSSHDRLQHLFTDLLAPLAEALGMIVIDGGTDAGVMQLMGLARAEIAARFPLVGIAAIEKICFPNASPSPGQHPLEPHHTHFILVPGQCSGDESPWIAQAAEILAGDAPSVSVLINGGRVSFIDVQESVAKRRPVIVIAGTGRLADAIAAAVLQPEQINEELSTVVNTGCFMLCPLSDAETQLTALLHQYVLQPSIEKY